MVPFEGAILTTLGSFREELQQSVPAAVAADRMSHLGAAFSHAIEVPMFEIHAGGTIRQRRKQHFDFAGPGKIGLEAPLMRDLPREREAVRRLPGGDLSPRTVGPVLLLAVHAAADERFDDGALQGRLADMVRTRPPGVEALGE